jgi:phage terminase large subunit
LATAIAKRAPSRLRSKPLVVNFPPLREHQRALYDHRQRFNVWVCHRRFGKTVLALYQLIADAYAQTRPRPRYGYLAPLYRQGKVIAWDLLKHLTRPLPGTKINEAELRVDLTGDRRIQIFGADNPDALRGLYLDGAVFDEYAQMRPRIWSEVVRPALADREGWATFIGTPMGKNHFYDLYHAAQHEAGWHRALYTVEDTQVLPEGELASARTTMAPEQYAQEFQCSFESALIGSYYGAYLETAASEQRITRVPWEPSVPVHLAFDLGISDATAIWFVQAVGRMFHCIEYLEASDHGLEWYAKVIKEKPYTLGRVYFPHDIEARDFSSDGRTRLAIAESLGLRPAVVVPRGNIGDGIAQVRTMFPRFLFDAEKCYEGLEALKAYRREWSETRKDWLDHPRHDFASHAADALRTFAMGYAEQPTLQLYTPGMPQTPPWARVPAGRGR